MLAVKYYAAWTLIAQSNLFWPLVPSPADLEKFWSE